MRSIGALALSAVVVVTCAACKEQPSERATKAADQKDFWPDAPKATAPTGKRRFAYKPENVTGYRLSAKGGNSKGKSAQVQLAFDLVIDFAFKAGAGAPERDAFMKTLTMDVSGTGLSMKMKLDQDRLDIVKDGQAMTIKRGEAHAIDVAAMVDKAFTTLVFEPTSGEVQVRTKSDHPFNQLGGDMLDGAFVLFPHVPPQEIAQGHTWTVMNEGTIGGGAMRHKVTYTFKYAGDGACPSGKPTCSLFTFSASSPSVAGESEGLKVRTTYGFAGKVYFDYERGVIDESRSHMEMDAAVEGAGEMSLEATYIIKPI
jgi:hypothetical protein